ncbi:MAG: glycoside hydrolase family 2 TIM barrel-domain containing protein [Bacteroidales bacterium]
MNRKLFLVLAIVGLLFSCKPDEYRNTFTLSGNWNFCIDSLNQGISENWAENGLPKEKTRQVKVPHTWNVEKGLEKYWGKAWYERNFEVPEIDSSKTYRLQFDAVYHDAIVFVNGKKAGEHIGSGYTKFYIDITSFIKKGENRLTVMADNYASRNSVPFLKSYDWSNDGGITRDVSMLITNKGAIKNILVVGTPDGQKGTANIIISFLKPDLISGKNVKLKAAISEENQETSKTIFDEELKGKFENGNFISELSFDKINPWHFDAPNLYKITVNLSVEGKVVDEMSACFGFRSIKVENNRYVLNGEPVRLMGLEWMPGSSLEHGMAETKQDLENNLKLMKGVNCIFTRFHWQQDDYVFDWCDRNGILVHEEIPYWGWTTMLNDTMLNLGKTHMDEMIEDHFNHPSIIAWGIGNELNSHDTSNITALKKLYNYAKSLDDSRLVDYVTNNLFNNYQIPDAASYFDIMMFNEYFSTWYGKSVDVVGNYLDTIHQNYPDKAITISEWGICEPVHKGGDTRRAKEMVQQLQIYSSKDYVAGAIYFCLNDYRTHMGEDFTYSYPQRVHGVVDINLKPKPSYDTLKIISSPVIVKSMKTDNKELVLELTGKKGIPEYVVKNYFLVSGTDKVLIDELKPGESKTFRIKPTGNEISILRPTGFEVLKVRIK